MELASFTVERVDKGNCRDEFHYRARYVTAPGVERVSFATVTRHVYEHHPEAFCAALLDLASSLADDYSKITGLPAPIQEASEAVCQIMALRDADLRTRVAQRLSIWDKMAEALNEGLANMERRKNA